ncbi:MAG: hypothetical protein Q7U68_02830 [Candidatus Roizmanbacteria bacterium]|nr:hypothetical protein [Candidatus Roizmanbacteria bacterium]
MQEKLLFVTKGGMNSDDGFSYVLELAKALNTGISVLMVYGRQVISTYEDVMAAVAFAEAGDLKTVREFMNKQEREIKEVEAEKIKELTEKCREVSLDLTYQVETGDTISLIKDFLGKMPNTKMVLISPNISGDKKLLDIKQLLKNITKPIVTITRQAKPAV